MFILQHSTKKPEGTSSARYAFGNMIFKVNNHSTTVLFRLLCCFLYSAAFDSSVL